MSINNISFQFLTKIMQGQMLDNAKTVQIKTIFDEFDNGENGDEKANDGNITGKNVNVFLQYLEKVFPSIHKAIVSASAEKEKNESLVTTGDTYAVYNKEDGVTTVYKKDKEPIVYDKNGNIVNEKMKAKPTMGLVLTEGIETTPYKGDFVDSTYQKYVERLKKMDEAMRTVEDKYNFSREDEFGVFKIKDEELRSKYTKIQLMYKMDSETLQQYKPAMDSWQDGKKYDFVQHNSTKYTNVEAITLKNGEHAWRSDQGVFYPYLDGSIGGPKVPEELL